MFGSRVPFRSSERTQICLPNLESSRTPINLRVLEWRETNPISSPVSSDLANFHQDFIRGKVTLVGCPKLDAGDYSEKLTEIIAKNDIKSVTVVRMEVPCCGGLEHAAKTALQNSGKFIPWQVVTIPTDGRILDTI